MQATLPYTSFVDVKQYSDTIAAQEGYDMDCLLNNALIKSVVCNGVCDKSSDEQIISNANNRIDVDYLVKFKALCTDPCPLPQADIDRICMLKGFGLAVENIFALYADSDPGVVTAAYDSCP